MIRGITTLWKKESRDFFSSPLVYILAGIFCALMGWLFYNYLIASKDITNKTLSMSILIPTYGNMNFIFLFLAPLLTMKLFSEEKKLHTLDLLLQSNLNHFQIIAGKFLAGLTVMLFMLSLTLIFPIILSFSGYNDWGTVASSYAGIVFSIMCYLSVGIFASSLTDNQIVAALSGFGILMFLMLLVLTSNATHNVLLQQIFSYLSTPYHFESFVRGAFRSYNLIYFVSFIGFFFYLTHKSLDSRNW
ncbi:MAG: ABC transporter permease subunit [Halobacteriovoraceae bacterium]|jgi:ABC-2 type transport system permease protein|nr:ABC transporter permease subunit [Halobacteriovoraceae bacterium]MBT5095639.1 ABC transporter permease subunit [Halobacteriovoraceae bacterium]